MFLEKCIICAILESFAVCHHVNVNFAGTHMDDFDSSYKTEMRNNFHLPLYITYYTLKSVVNKFQYPIVALLQTARS